MDVAGGLKPQDVTSGVGEAFSFFFRFVVVVVGSDVVIVVERGKQDMLMFNKA